MVSRSEVRHVSHPSGPLGRAHASIRPGRGDPLNGSDQPRNDNYVQLALLNSSLDQEKDIDGGILLNKHKSSCPFVFKLPHDTP